jgi:hypothetical protein
VGRHAGSRGQRGQASVEWLALVLVVSVALAAALAAGFRPPIAGIARAIGAAIVCAVELGDCGEDSELVAAYGPDVASLVRAHAPEIRYEAGMTALPVDFRSCRGPRCDDGPASGAVWTSVTGEPVTAFVRVIDCRQTPAGRDAVASAVDCSGERSGRLYLQYWLFYEDSTSWGRTHRDDWEGYQVRVGSGPAEARATSHHGYNHRAGPGSWLSDAGITHRAAWGSDLGHLYVSGGSHAGHVTERRDDLLRAARNERTRWHPQLARLRATRHGPRWTPAARLRLVPLESLSATDRATTFAVSPPWRKTVYRDPEWEGT